MKKSLLALAFMATLTGSAIGQNKTLTLEDAVMNQWRSFYPKQLRGVAAVPTEAKFTFIDAAKKAYMVQGLKAKRATVLFEQKALAAAFELELRYLPKLTWVDATTFYFSYGGHTGIATIDPKGVLSKKAWLKAPKGANTEFNLAAKAFAYTKGNNLFVLEEGGAEKAVTNNTDKNIVSGQAIARYEFGISKGTFWSPDGNLLAFYQKDETDVTD